MHMLKLLFQKLQIRPALAPGRDSQPPGGTAKGDCLRTSWGIRVIMFQEETDDRPPWEQLTAPGENAAVFFHQISPEFQNPSPHLVYSLL